MAGTDPRIRSGDGHDGEEDPESATLQPLASRLAQHDAFLLANHGATTVGPTLTIAHQRMESLEHSARILFTARALGRVNPLTAQQVEALVDARRRAVPGAPFAGCPVPRSDV